MSNDEINRRIQADGQTNGVYFTNETGCREWYPSVETARRRLYARYRELDEMDPERFDGLS
jgi:hypothetical protein